MALSDLQEELAPERVAELHRDGQIELIDVREDYEHEAGHIAGSRHVKFDALTQAASGLEKDRAVVFYCRSGSRSAVATQAFRASGYDAHNMTGGLLAWDFIKLPLEPQDGSVADH
jgi:rhodanese-related sulfurtransferase